MKKLRLVAILLTSSLVVGQIRQLPSREVRLQREQQSLADHNNTNTYWVVAKVFNVTTEEVAERIVGDDGVITETIEFWNNKTAEVENHQFVIERTLLSSSEQKYREVLTTNRINLNEAGMAID